MPNKTVSVNKNTYTKLDTTSESALDCQNVGDNKVRVSFSTTQPTSGGYFVPPGKGVIRNGHVGDMWVKSIGGPSIIEVGE